MVMGSGTGDRSMKKQSKANLVYNVIVIGVIIGLAVYWGWDPLVRWLNVSKAVGDIATMRDTAKARETLREQNDRQYVLGKIHEALDDEDTSIDGKIALLQTLIEFKDARTVRLAVESDVPSTRRAAVWMRQGDGAVRDIAEKVVLDWLKDEGADSRSKAAILAKNFKFESAVPVLLELLDQRYTTDDGRETVRGALAALAELKPEGLAPKLMAMARDPQQHEAVRGEALNAVAGLEDAPREEVTQLAIDIVTDPKVADNKLAARILRGKALGVLRRPSYGSPKVWDALEGVLLDTNDDDEITQRGCLNALGNSAPLDRVRKLLLDRRVYRHPYFALRIDVATALAALNMRERQALQILNEYLVDQDAADRQHQVRQEGYLSLFVLTGASYGVDQKDLFQRRVRPISDPERTRAYMWRSSFLRPGVTKAQVEAVKRIVGDLATMKQIKQTYEQHQETILKAWEDEKKPPAKDEEKKDEGAGKGETKDKGAADAEKKDEPSDDGEPKEDDG
jgi:phage shock protein PspC (stress-responsive transcriptional regulator)